MDNGERRHIGDGVYVEYDGHGIMLKANDITVPTDMIYLEPEVAAELIKFIKTAGVA
jgi:hypothetical protein